MTKQDLKTGMIIEQRCGNIGKVLLNTERGDLIGADGNSRSAYSQLDNYEDNLTWNTASSDFDIVKVYSMSIHNLDAGAINDDGKLLWERNETKEYTVKELIKLVGHEFKIKK